ncbi:[protein-PII] uridylyltransferase [Brevundimonas sp. G8]|uniref:[protein-PII] uridylyltransferase n=1 Tax=Brevundimonas sp. G8 TaxID=1350776 RepID=UPI00135CA143|nr:[protein-PII] uridylyltransferase [Brevundimonas sp. G8]
MIASPSLDDRLDEAARAGDPRAAVSVVLRETYDAARARAERKLDGGMKGREVARIYATAADDMLAGLWRVATQILFPVSAVESERLSLVAVGGYGRGVLAPFSDLDLLFLRPAKATLRGESVIQFVLYVLWDLGVKVGPAVRSVEECLSLSRTDMTVRTTLLEARHLAGDERLSDLMIGRFRDMVSKSDPRPFIAAKLEERAVRHQKAGVTRYKVEPNVKDGKGGLRDLNTLYWIARSLAPDSRLGATVMDEMFTSRERRASDDAFDFLWRVRIHLHLIAGRAEEKLTFDMQPEVARRMGWQGRGDEPAVERFMRRYFLVARDVGALTRAMSAKLEARHQKTAQGLSRLMTSFRSTRRKLEVEGFWVDQGRLSVEGPEVFAADPVKLLTLFVCADKHDLDLHPDAFSAVTRSLSLVTPRLRRDPAATRAFLDILAHGQRPYRVLTIMNETGLLGRFLPEWGRIVGQTQFNMYHAYTVDEHTLQAIGIINDIARGKLKDDHPLATEIVQLISDMEALMLGMLLHDVGKGGERGQLEDGAIAARRACERLGVDPRRIELVVWLVRSHLALSDYAQKRDLSDPATIRAFAKLVGEPERLRMLLVLTVADIRAVGPGVWNGWKGQLMRTLYNQVAALFRGEDVAREDPLAAHPALVERARQTGAAGEAAPTPPVAGLAVQTTEISIAAADRPGLFADLAQTMAALGADVTDARVATTSEGLVLDVFRIQDGAGLPYGQAEPRRIKTLVEALEKAARGDGRIGKAPDPTGNARKAAFEVRPVVMVDHHASELATVVEVSCADRPGLLAALSRVFNDEGLNIRSAHVASYGERAVDSFYVVDLKGRKVTSEQRIAELRTALEAVLDSRAPAPAGRKVASARASARDVSDLGRRSPRAKPVSPAGEAR